MCPSTEAQLAFCLAVTVTQNMVLPVEYFMLKYGYNHRRGTTNDLVTFRITVRIFWLHIFKIYCTGHLNTIKLSL